MPKIKLLRKKITKKTAIKTIAKATSQESLKK